MSNVLRLAVYFVSMVGAAVSCDLGYSTTPDFGREVRPILAKHCYKCHGPDPNTREADLRLDVVDDAVADRGGYSAVVPGDPDASEVLVRITSDDPDLQMPPSEPLSPSEIETLRKWIAAGGDYETHWAFLPPSKPNVPIVEDINWCQTPIDRFILSQMRSRGLSPSPRSTRTTLIRRLYLDLCGVSPTPEQVERFVADPDPNAYRRLVDELLGTPEYAERFARPWLDLARYSDTNGYEKDRPRSIWPFRDWVIQAISDDMPFDQFTIEQLAGDMLPKATNAQRIATGFHRNTMLNEEGGIDPQEYRYYALVDRVATTGTVWMGLTIGCAQCHTHKYDPITHTDYYSLLALLNQADEPDVIVANSERDQQQDDIRDQIQAMERILIDEYLPSFDQWKSGVAFPPGSIADDFMAWLKRQADASRHWKRIRPDDWESTLPKLSVMDDDSILASGDVTKREVYRLSFPLEDSQIGATAIRLEVLPHASLPAGGPGLAFYEGRRGDFFLSELTITLNGAPVGMQNASHSYGKIAVGSGSADASNVLDGEGSTGWSTANADGKANQWVANFDEPIATTGRLEIEMLFERHFAAGLGRFRFSLSAGDAPAVASKLSPDLYDWRVQSDWSGLTSTDFAALQRDFLRSTSRLAEERQPIEKLERTIPAKTRTLGMRQRATEDYRTTYRHHRGEYLQAKEPVTPAVPSAFPSISEGEPRDRLGLARWLMSDKNPLAARVTVNRAWREFFGVGIVHTAGDFGTQSEPPTHPDLLDWLAIDLQETGWSMKRLHRQIVLSAVYQQSVGRAPASDPKNRYLSTFPHRRLNAEQIRDSLLSASGLLARTIGGPSVYPPQPRSVTALAYGSPAWPVSKGADRFRRSLYTFSRRTAPFAAYVTFDAPTGETCAARRERSTTPLQALTLLNDEMYVEMARGLAEATLRELPDDVDPKRVAERIFRRVLIRKPTDSELGAILSFYDRQSNHTEAWMLVARALINTDEAITVP
ncbi:MAG: PSD1 and planctomycete cytochrome C domain-containing protein [Planctomycetota bacterium]